MIGAAASLMFAPFEIKQAIARQPVGAHSGPPSRAPGRPRLSATFRHYVPHRAE
jgi:hypothetical protein